MEILPSTTIHLLKGVPLDNTYKHTVIFPDNNTQHATFFNNFEAKELRNNTYQRVNKGRLRVGILADEIYGYNYMMFRNVNYGSKWFYAFITNMEYVNDVTTEIYYEIDVMQTYHFDYQLMPSYVEREHSATDRVGEHLLPEPVELGLVACMKTYEPDYFHNYSVVIAMANDVTTRTTWIDPHDMSEAELEAHQRENYPEVYKRVLKVKEGENL